MTIELITPEQHAELLNIYNSFPELTLENKGYEYIRKEDLKPEAKEALNIVTAILKQSIQRFSSFSNFRHDRAGNIQLRVQYGYDERFTGVGYLLLDELLNGFSN